MVSKIWEGKEIQVTHVWIKSMDLIRVAGDLISWTFIISITTVDLG